MTRLALACALALGSAGCTGVPAAVVWTTTGAGLGFGAAVLTFDTTALQVWNQRHPVEPPVAAP